MNRCVHCAAGGGSAAHAELGRIRQVGSPISFDGRQGGSIRRAPPVLGEHTFEVLREHGYAQRGPARRWLAKASSCSMHKEPAMNGGSAPTLEIVGLDWRPSRCAVPSSTTASIRTTPQSSCATSRKSRADAFRAAAGDHRRRRKDLLLRIHARARSARAWIDRFEDMLDALESLDIPTLCALNGSAYGGGTDLALACDFRIGVRGCRLFMPAARFGLHYYPGGLAALRHAARLFGSQEDLPDRDDHGRARNCSGPGSSRSWWNVASCSRGIAMYRDHIARCDAAGGPLDEASHQRHFRGRMERGLGQGCVRSVPAVGGNNQAVEGTGGAVRKVKRSDSRTQAAAGGALAESPALLASCATWLASMLVT